MVLSKRERYIGIITLVVLSILVLDSFLISPALQRMEELDGDIALAQQQHRSAQQLFTASNRAKRNWNQMPGDAMRPGGGSGGDPESRVLNNVRQWAQDEGMRLPSLIPQPATQEKGFNKHVFRATGNGSLSQVGRFLYRLQTASMPLRITDLQINATKEGVDELTVTFGIATISPIPQANRAAGAGVNPGREQL